MLDILFMALYVTYNYELFHNYNYGVVYNYNYFIIIITVFDFLIPNKEIIWNQT